MMPDSMEGQAEAAAAPTPDGVVDGLPGWLVATCYALLWLCGFGMRATILIVPPVVPLLHADLGLSQTGIGVLSGLPSMLFALAAVPGSFLIARFGAVATLAFGLFVCAAGSAARAGAFDAWPLYATTVLMSAGVAVMQPAMPQLVRAWLPRRIGFATAVYMSGLLMGEILAVSITLPVVLPLAGGSWRWAFVIWSVPVVAIGFLVARLAPRPPILRAGAGTGGGAWWPQWRRKLVWQLGFLLGALNSIYFSTNAFLPDFLTEAHRPERIGDALTALNLSQLPASFLMLVLAGRLVRRRSVYVGCALLMIVGLAGIVFMGGERVVLWSAVLGFANGTTLILAFALPPLLCRPDEVHRTSAGMFAISYTTGVLTPVIGGFLWDLTGHGAVGFIPILVWPFIIAFLAIVIDLHDPKPKHDFGRSPDHS